MHPCTARYIMHPCTVRYIMHAIFMTSLGAVMVSLYCEWSNVTAASTCWVGEICWVGERLLCERAPVDWVSASCVGERLLSGRGPVERVSAYWIDERLLSGRAPCIASRWRCENGMEFSADEIVQKYAAQVKWQRRCIHWKLKERVTLSSRILTAMYKFFANEDIAIYIYI